MNRSRDRRPPEPEEADGEEKRSNGHGQEPAFWDGFAARSGHEAGVARLVREVDGDGAEDADKQCEEGEGGGDCIPPSDFCKDEGENRKCEVEHGVDEGGVEGDTCDHGLGEEHPERAREVLGDDGLRGQLDVLVRVVEGGVAGSLAQLDRATFEEHRGVDLGEAKHADCGDGYGPDCFNVGGPSPSHAALDQDCSANGRSQCRSCHDADGVKGHGCSAVLGFVDVA